MKTTYEKYISSAGVYLTDKVNHFKSSAGLGCAEIIPSTSLAISGGTNGVCGNCGCG